MGARWAVTHRAVWCTLAGRGIAPVIELSPTAGYHAMILLCCHLVGRILQRSADMAWGGAVLAPVCVVHILSGRTHMDVLAVTRDG